MLSAARRHLPGFLVLLVGLVFTTDAVPTVAGGSLRPFAPGAPAPGELKEPAYWRADVSPGVDRYAVYRDTVWRDGGQRFTDSVAYLWDREARQLVRLTDHAGSADPAIAADGSVVVFDEQRDPQTRTGPNPDPWLHRIARWERATGTVTGLTEFRFRAVVDIELSGDGSTVAFMGDADVYAGPADGSGPLRDITSASADRSRGSSYSPGQRYLSVANDGHLVVYQDARGQGEVFLHDRRAGTTESVHPRLPAALGVDYTRMPSLCADGSRLAFVAGRNWRREMSGGRHRTQDAAMVLDLASGRIVASSQPFFARNAETQYARSVVLSPDCRHVAYAAPGRFDGVDLDRDDTWRPDALVVMDADSGDAERVVRIGEAPVAFLPGDEVVLQFEGGRTLALGRLGRPFPLRRLPAS